MPGNDTEIAVVSTTCLQVPPEGYGGTELMVYNLAHELGARGYDVTCIATQGTEIEGVDVVETTPSTDTQDCFRREPEAFEMYAGDLPGFDVVVDHSWNKLSYSKKAREPATMADTAILGAFHGMPHDLDVEGVERTNFLAVAETTADLWELQTGYEFRHAHNGIDLAKYPLSPGDDGYLMTLNRIMPEKGILECVELADEHGVALKVVGEDEFVEDHGYVLEVIDRCRRSNHADYVGKVDADRKTDLLGDARGLVLLPRHPYREAFGLAAVEAMAAGTPVIATDNTGLGEVVRTVQGTGAYDDLDRVGEAMCDLAGGDGGFPGPEALRTGVEEHFSKAAMADAYLDRIDEAVAEGW